MCVCLFVFYLRTSSIHESNLKSVCKISTLNMHIYPYVYIYTTILSLFPPKISRRARYCTVFHIDAVYTIPQRISRGLCTAIIILRMYTYTKQYMTLSSRDFFFFILKYVYGKFIHYRWSSLNASMFMFCIFDHLIILMQTQVQRVKYQFDETLLEFFFVINFSSGIWKKKNKHFILKFIDFQLN